MLTVTNKDSNQFSFKKLEILKYFYLFSLNAGELALRWNQIYPSLLNMFEKLKKLGFTYYNGKVSVIELKGETNE